MSISRESRLAAEQFANAVSTAIEELGITRYRLAKIMKVKYSTAVHWCDRGLTPSAKHFLPLCEELGLDPANFGFKKSRAVHGGNRGRLTGTRRRLESSPLIITQWR